MNSNKDVEQEILNLAQQLLRESGSEYSQRNIALNLSLQRHLGIDSIGRAELFQRIEKAFNIQFPDQLMADADTLQDIANAVFTAVPGQKPTHHQPQQPILEKSIINPQQAKTLIDVLLLYATGDPDRPHIYLQDDQGREEVITYGKLFENSQRVAHAMIKRGLKAGETVAIMQPTNAGFFYTFFGTLLANCIPVPIYPPFRPHQIEAYAKHESKILNSAQARMLVTFHEAENLSKLLRAFVPSLKNVVTVNDLLKDDEKAPIFGANIDDFALIQYTSGSTSIPKGVLLSHRNLLANIRAYGQAINITHHDVCVSWVPLYHDLGLIGMWFGSLYYGIPLALMSPLTFLNRPERWLWAIHHHRGTLSGGPNFAYELCVRKIEPAMIEGLDLSSWRIAANGAEAIQPKTLERFTEKFAPYGFNPRAHLPVYGLAESTVCVAVSKPNAGPRLDKIDRTAFEEKSQAIPSNKPNSLEFVGCGQPIAGHEVRIVDNDNQVLPERRIGQLQFKGPSSMQGYYGNPDATLAIYHDGWWDSGDLAYIADGDIFITGRKKDVIIKTGRNLYPAELEELTAQVSEIRKGCVIAFGVTDTQRGTEKLVIVAETRDKKPKNPEKIIEQINEKIITALDVAPDHVVLVTPHTIPKTSSGKLQRAACKASYVSGKLAQRNTPLWLQLTKIGLGSALAKLSKLTANLFKLIYTFYASFITVITLIPVYLLLWILPQRTCALLCKYWARLLFLLLFCPILLKGRKNLSIQKPVIFAANHASYVDALLLLAILPAQTRFIGKQELLQNPILRHFMKKLGYIAVSRTSAKGIEETKQMEQVLRDGFSLLIFPEGTFSYAAGLRPFRMGAFKIAAETNTAVCPISINGTRSILRGDERLLKPNSIRITIHEPIAALGKEWQELISYKDLVRAQIAKDCGEPTLDLITTHIAEEE